MFFDLFICLLQAMVILVILCILFLIVKKNPKIIVMAIFIAVLLYVYTISPSVAEPLREEKAIIIGAETIAIDNETRLLITAITEDGNIYQYWADANIILLLEGDNVKYVEGIKNDYNSI